MRPVEREQSTETYGRSNDEGQIVASEETKRTSCIYNVGELEQAYFGPRLADNERSHDPYFGCLVSHERYGCN